MSSYSVKFRSQSPQHQQQSVPGSKTSTGRLQLSENINTLLASSFLSRWAVTPMSHDGLGQVQISNWGLPFLTFFRPTFNKILIRLDFDSILNNFQIRAPDKTSSSSCGSNLKLRVLCPLDLVSAVRGHLGDVSFAWDGTLPAICCLVMRGYRWMWCRHGVPENFNW